MVFSSTGALVAPHVWMPMLVGERMTVLHAGVENNKNHDT
jgi:hypothetical protein